MDNPGDIYALLLGRPDLALTLANRPDPHRKPKPESKSKAWRLRARIADALHALATRIEPAGATVPRSVLASAVTPAD
jgi:hypothetical protein